MMKSMSLKALTEAYEQTTVFSWGQSQDGASSQRNDSLGLKLTNRDMIIGMPPICPNFLEVFAVMTQPLQSVDYFECSCYFVPCKHQGEAHFLTQIPCNNLHVITVLLLLHEPAYGSLNTLSYLLISLSLYKFCFHGNIQEKHLFIYVCRGL